MRNILAQPHSERRATKVITVSGFSKTFAMTGWRIGTFMACEPIAKAIAKLQSQMTSNATTFGQYGALAAIENKTEAKAALNVMRQAFDKRRLLLLEGLNSIKGITCLRAEGAFVRYFPKLLALVSPLQSLHPNF